MSFTKAVYIGAGLDIQRPIRLNPEIREWIMVDYQRGPEFLLKLYQEALKEDFCWKLRINNEIYQKLTTEEVESRIEQLIYQNPVLLENEEFDQKIYYYHSIVFPNRIDYQYSYIPQYSLPDYPAEYIQEMIQDSRTLVCGGYTPHPQILEWMHQDSILFIIYEDENMDIRVEEEEEMRLEVGPNMIYYLMENEEKIFKIVYFPECKSEEDLLIDNRYNHFECNTISELNEYSQLQKLRERIEMEYIEDD
jgi:hypothetical protein